MGLAIQETMIYNMMDVKSNAELQLQNIMTSLQRLAMSSSDIATRQSAEMQAYIAANKDEEGYPEQSAIDYVNSAAFNAKYEKQLKMIQVKENEYEMMKKQTELRLNNATAAIESWKKADGIKSFFKYFQ